MARKPRKPDPEDDGRTIANMNVDGMPWYDERLAPGGDRKGGTREQMTPEERRAYTWAAIKAGLLVVLIFALVFGLFIAFCDFVWFA